MVTDRSNFYVITGGPGAGKTSIVDALRARDYACVCEVGRAIIREQVKIGGNALHAGDRETFRELMLSRSIQGFELAANADGPVFFDRGIPGLVGYCRLSNMAVPDHLRNAVRLFRYNLHVFVTPPWPEIYRNDGERKQNFAEAVATYETVVAAYVEAGYEPIEVPKATVSARVDFVLAHVAAWTTPVPSP